jgi:hypothetical protein
VSDWRAYGDYTGDDCPNCGRQRLMTAEDPTGRERVICEKCMWEPAANDYAPELDEAAQ